jgi:4-hydroxy-tetrahydrodipicolinate reductase
LELIEEKSAHFPIFRSANMSLGVNLMYELVHRAASVLGDLFDIEIIEKHHNQKIDSPSGTAYALADSINAAFLNSKHYIFGRHSKNDRRAANEIGIHAVRGGTIAGEHSVIYAGRDEILEITHSAHSKQIFALGALEAAKYIKGKAPGLYDMKDVMLEQSAVTNIYTSNDEVLVTVYQMPSDTGMISALFSKLARESINIDMISQTAPANGLVNVSFTLPEKHVNKAINVIGEFNTANPTVRTDVFINITKLTVEGLGMEHQSGVAARIFEIMAKQGIGIKIITTSETKISFVIDQIDEKSAVEAIIDAFGL